MNKKGFTLMEVVIAVGLLALVSVVSISIVTNLIRSAVKSQVNVDIEQASNFVLLKMENDISKSYSASVPNSKTLVLTQPSSTTPVVVTYRIKTGAADQPNSISVQYGTAGSEITLTDNTLVSVGGKPTASAVSVDLASPGFSVVSDSTGPLAVNVVIKFVKPTVEGAIGSFSAESTLNTTIVLSGAY